VFRGTLSDSEPLLPQVNAIIRAASTISTLGIKLEDKLVAFAIISSLPPSMNILKKILSNTKPSDMTTENVMSQITLDEQQRVRESGVSATAFFAKIVQDPRPRHNRVSKAEEGAAGHKSICYTHT